MVKIKMLVKCSDCETRWYIGTFENINCPGCHGDPELVEVPYASDNAALVDFLCPTCFTIWEQEADKKFKCPSCGEQRTWEASASQPVSEGETK